MELRQRIEELREVMKSLEIVGEDCREVVELARAYLSDASHFLSKGKFEATKQTEFDISKNAEFAGMIIASYYAKRIEHDSMEDFFKLIIEKAGQKGFRNYSGRGLTLNKVFENSKVTFAGKRYHISLRLGLWKVTL